MRQNPAPGHTQMRRRIGGLDPSPSVLKPGFAVRFGLDGHPRDLVVAPDKRRGAGISRIAATEIVELRKPRQIGAGPSAGGDATFALGEQGVGIADLKLAFTARCSHLLDAQGEGVKVEKGCPIDDIIAGRRSMGVAKHHVPARMQPCIGSNFRKHVQPIGVIRIRLIHKPYLAEMKSLDADVDVVAGQEIEVHAGFQLTHVRH